MMYKDNASRRYHGAYSVVPTIFFDSGEIDYNGQRRCVDFIIEAGADGVCILANYSEQFSLSDDERARLMESILDHVAGRVPVIVTTTHFSPRVCGARCRAAQAAGAAMVMIMPPYHGATVRCAESAIADFFSDVAHAIDIPIMYQDAPMSGTEVSTAFLVRLAQAVPNLRYFKIEVPQSARKLRELISLGGDLIEGPWDGEEAITLLADLDAGATGSILGGGYPDGLRPILTAYLEGRRNDAVRIYEKWLPLINYENRQAGLLACKALMKEGGIIASDAPRRPLAPLHPATRAGLIEIATRLDSLVLRWAQ